MASDSELSGDENVDDFGQLDIVDIPRRVQNDLERQFRQLVGDSDEESDFGGFEPEDIYEIPDFDNWEKEENDRTIVEFNERTGPKRVLDPSNDAVNFFQMFYTDEVFQHIVECTNINAELKRGADLDKHKGEWTDVILDEIKAYYGILLLMDIMNFTGQIITNIGFLAQVLEKYLHEIDLYRSNDTYIFQMTPMLGLGTNSTRFDTCLAT